MAESVVPITEPTGYEPALAKDNRPRTGDICQASGIWVSRCSHSPKIALALGEVFPPCRRCLAPVRWVPAADVDADEEEDQRPWRGLFTDLAGTSPPVGFRLPPEPPLPPARPPVPNLGWLPDHEDEDG